ncbi:protein of unknown function [Paraburkholderia dioscoreae]|uniref:Uncharacterized protein n=1 Tax=Paraburkholderia dioscoreae TaxID=2604047 RepID=A0A5Q4ZNL7_9BURK|nr:protein of unknown function [Paraburkholderia dioscoreae]
MTLPLAAPEATVGVVTVYLTVIHIL